MAWGGRAPDGSGELGQHVQRLFQDARLIQRHHELIHLCEYMTLNVRRQASPNHGPDSDKCLHGSTCASLPYILQVK